MCGKYKIFLNMIYKRYKQNEFTYSDVKDIISHPSYLRAMTDRKMLNKIRHRRVNIYKISDKYIDKLKIL